MASSRPRIFWTVLEEPSSLWTKGWLPDSDSLRWSLAAAVRVEGIREGWGPCHESAEGAVIHHSYVGVTEDGDFAECCERGEDVSGEPLSNAQPVTIALLHLTE